MLVLLAQYETPPGRSDAVEPKHCTTTAINTNNIKKIFLTFKTGYIIGCGLYQFENC